MTHAAGTSAGATEPTRRAAPARRSRRLDPAVSWALGLYLVSFPLMLVWLVLITAAAAEAGFDLQDADGPAPRIANAVYVVLVLSTLVAACGVGIYGWVRRRRRAALLVAVLSAVTAVAFVVFPAVAA